ncbi:antitermination regulator [Arthrobacter sp. G.S.26]|uniref:antitermination regulator n=2 Tax=Micrococcales TaxID=85006 RepID=UPI003D7751D2
MFPQPEYLAHEGVWGSIQTHYVRADFPDHLARVLNGAGDEEAFETEASPPAVAGPLFRPAPTVTDAQRMEALLDPVADADDLTGSIELLVAAAARAVILEIGGGSSAHPASVTALDCGLVVSGSGRPVARHGTSARAAALLDRGVPATAAGTGTGEGPVAEVLAGGPPVVVLQGAADIRWPGYSTRLAGAGFGSMLAVRLRLRPGASAALVFFVPDPAAFPLPAIAAARAFAVLAGRSLQLALDLHNAGAMVAAEILADWPDTRTLSHR